MDDVCANLVQVVDNVDNRQEHQMVAKDELIILMDQLQTKQLLIVQEKKSEFS